MTVLHGANVSLRGGTSGLQTSRSRPRPTHLSLRLVASAQPPPFDVATMVSNVAHLERLYKLQKPTFDPSFVPTHPPYQCPGYLHHDSKGRQPPSSRQHRQGRRLQSWPSLSTLQAV